MKILIFSGKLTGGGAERVAVNMAEGLVDLGHDVTICCEPIGEKTYTPSSLVNLEFYPLQIRKSIFPKINVFARIWYMVRMIRRISPNVIIGIIGDATCMAKIAQSLSFKHIPVIYSDHNTLQRPNSALMSKREKFLKFHFSKYCDAYTVLTEADKKYGETLGLKNIVVMPNPLFLQPIKVFPSKEKIILANGRLNDWHCKGFDLLIEAWGKIASNHLDWRLQILGAGDEKDKETILHFARKNKVEKRIDLLGYTKDVALYYQRAEIFVLASRYEGFGLVLTEAMSQGCACVAADYKGRQGEIITDGVDGLLCQTDNIEDLVEKLQRLIENNDLRHYIQASATKNLDRFSIQTYAKRWDKLICKLI